MRRHSWVAAAVLALSCALSACRKAPAAANKADAALAPVKVATITVGKRSMPRELPLTGTLVAERASDVAADGAGKVVTAPIERGMFVKQGALLAQLDTRNAALSAREAKAGLQLAQAQLDLAKTDCTRAEQLFKAGTITGADYDKIQTQCATGTLSVTEAEARRDAAAKQLGDTAVRAPFAGVVAERFVEAGEYVGASSKVARIVSLDPIRLDLSVPEGYVKYASAGMTVKFSVEAFPDEPFEGKVKFLGAELRMPSRDLLIEAEVANGDQRLRPGMFAVARLELPPADVVVVPKVALKSDGIASRAYVVIDGKLVERLVETGVDDGTFIEIRKGVVEGEALVSPMVADARDGAPVDKVAAASAVPSAVPSMGK